ncbi:MAG: hypothetical protein J07HX64_01849 [halophilic archaeon J07HX64]|nr:MAG: hypothetical protein J07HX64_01849 [halophilic archaeon J07HX64]
MVLFLTLLVSAVVASGAGIGQIAAAQGGDDPVATFNATGTDGFVAIDTDSPDDPITFPTPDEVEQPISLDAELFGNGTWRSTEVSFPDLGEEQLGFPVQIRLEAPRPFEGTIDRETGEMTVDAALEILVPDANATVPVRANLTTGTSGEMRGETEGLDTDSATVTLVGNEFTVPEETGNTIIDGFVGLPAPEPGINWFSLTLEMSFDTETGGVTGVVESTEGGAVEGATVSLGGQQTTTGADGSYEFDAPAGTGEVTVERFGFDGVSESATVVAGETATVDVELAPVETGTVAGTVESVDGDPVEGATVRVGDRQLTTGADGSYELGVETGTRELAVSAKGFTDTSRSVLVEVDTVSTGDIELDPANPEFAPVTLVRNDATVGERIEVTAFVQNVGVAGGTEPVTVSVGDESVTESVTLGPAQVGTVSLGWETGTGDEGVYEATVTVSERTEQADVVVEGPEFTVDVSAGDVVPGDTATVTATVRNSDDITGARAVTVSLTGTGDDVVDPVTESVELGPGEETELSLEWQTAEADAGEYEATAEVGGQTTTERVIVDESVGEADFLVTSTGGYMTYGYDTLANAEGQGLEFPDKNAGEDPIRIWGVIDEAEGTWESVRTEFPTIVQEGLEGRVEVIGGLQGQVDRETGLLTATATYRIVIEGDEDTAFEFNMTMTTGESGEMTDLGSYRETNDTFAEVTFVSNDFRVDDQTGDSLADSTLRLPSPERGQNYVELEFEADYDPGEQPNGGRQDQSGENGNGETVETGASGTLIATLGQGVGFLGLAGVFIIALAGLYARVTSGDGETGE